MLRQMRLTERTGVIVIRVWIEGGGDDGFRARISATPDVSRPERTTFAAGSLEDVVQIVRDWLEEFLEAR
jgi:hypothetical protein